MVQLICERDLSQDCSDEIDGEWLFVGVRAHDLLDSGGGRLSLRESVDG